MNRFLVIAYFTDEQSCRLHFKKERGKQGVVCKTCEHTEYYWLQSKWLYQYKKRTCRTSLRSGTITESSKFSFLIWDKMMFLMSATKKGFSSKETQKQLGLKSYEPVWAMVHRVISNRDAQYTLEVW